MPDILVGSESVEIVPDARRFAKLLAKDVAPASTTLGKQIGAQLSETIARGIRDGLGDGFKAAPAQAQRRGRESGTNFAGAFDKEVRTKVRAALQSLPDVDIDADSSQAQKEIAQVRASLERLSGQRIGVDIDEATALNRLESLQRKLAEISANDDATISVKANTTQAALELDKIKVSAERVGAMRPTVTVDADTAAAQAQIAAVGSTSVSSTAGVSGLIATGLLLGPALVPAAAAATAGLIGLSAAAFAAAGGVGVAILAFAGIGDAVKSVAAAEDSAAADAETASARRVASARQIESAQESLASAQTAQSEQAQRSARDVADAEHGITDALRGVEDAQRGVEDARRSAADGVQAALDRVRAAEEAETQAVRDAKTAQDSLNMARADAKRALQDLQMQLRDGELSEEQASISVDRARQRLSQPFKSGIDQRQANLDYEQAKANLDEIRVRNQRLAAEKKKSDKAGIDGSTQVLAAQRQLTDAQQRQKDASASVATAEQDVTRAREEGARRVVQAQRGVADAQQRVTDAQQRLVDAQTQQQRTAVRSSQAIVKAQRDVTRAQADAAAAADKSSAAQTKAQQAMASLSPEGRKFAAFILGLRGGLSSLQRDAAKGFLPGLETGMRAAGKALAPFRGVVGSVAREMGRMATSAGKSFGGKTWQSFFGMVSRTAAPTLRLFGSIVGSLGTSFAGLAVAFQPIATDVLKGLDGLMKRFAAFSTGKGGGLQKIIDYVRENGPKFASMLGSVGRAFVRIVQAVAPFAGPVMSGIQRVADAIAGMPVERLTTMIGVVVGLTLAWKAAMLAVRAVDGVLKIYNATTAVGNGLKKVSTLWTNRETAATVRSTIATKAKTFATKAAAVAQRLLNLAMRMNPIGMIITALVALGAGLVLLYKKHEGFRNVVNRVWASVQKAAMSVVGWFRNTALPWMRGAFTSIGNAGKWLWQKALGPAFRGIGMVISWWYRNVVKRYFSLVGTILRGAGRLAMWLWRNALAPAFRGIGAVASWLWSKAIRPTFSRVGGAFRTAASVAKWLYRNGIRPAFQSIGDKAGWLWGKTKDVFDKLKSGIRAVKNAFSSAKTGIGKIWGGLTDAISKPIRAAMKWIDENFIKKVKQLLNAVGLGDFSRDKVQYLVLGRHADGGKVLPSRAAGGPIPGPWRGPKADNVLGISDAGVPTARVNPREYITRVWATDRMERKHPGALAYINRYGDLPGHAHGGPVGLPGLAGGGMVYQKMADWLRQNMPGTTITSSYRPGSITASGNRSNHSLGKALDIVPAAMSTFNRLRAAWPNSSELIFSPAGGRQLKHGKPYTYGEPVKSMHYDHVHWAMDAFNGLGGKARGLAGGLLGSVVEKGKAALNALLSKAPKNFWSNIMVGFAKKTTAGLTDKISNAFGASDEGSSAFTFASKAGGNNVDLGRNMAAEMGWTGRQWLALKELWTRESNWNHLAKNPSSGAYGIPQSLPASKMASRGQGGGPDYLSNPKTQISWGLKYIKGRYRTPESALQWHNSHNWYHDGGRVTGYAGGTTSATPGPHWVGEHGPELVWFRGGEQVATAPRSQQIAAHVQQMAQHPAGPQRISGQLTIPGFGRGYIEGVVEDVVTDMNEGASALAGMGRS